MSKTRVYGENSKQALTIWNILKKQSIFSSSVSAINPNTEEQIVQAMAGVLAYNLAENDEKIKFDYSNSNAYQNSHEIEDELELWWQKFFEKILQKVLIF